MPSRWKRGRGSPPVFDERGERFRTVEPPGMEERAAAAQSGGVARRGKAPGKARWHELARWQARLADLRVLPPDGRAPRHQFLHYVSASNVQVLFGRCLQPGGRAGAQRQTD